MYSLYFYLFLVKDYRDQLFIGPNFPGELKLHRDVLNQTPECTHFFPSNFLSDRMFDLHMSFAEKSLLGLHYIQRNKSLTNWTILGKVEGSHIDNKEAGLKSDAMRTFQQR